MKYYRLLIQSGWDINVVCKGEIYPESHLPPSRNSFTVGEFTRLYPKDWELVFDDEITPIPKIKFLEEELTDLPERGREQVTPQE